MENVEEVVVMYSAMLSLKDKKVTIVGGGKVAYRKARLLSEEGCDLQVIAPHFIEAFDELNYNVNKIYKNYEEGDCAGSVLVFAATDDETINAQVGEYCQRAKILCNVTNDASLSSFSTPAQLKRGDLTISVSTAGNSPSLAAQIKDELARTYGEEYGQQVKLLGEIRERVLKGIKDEEERKKILNRVSKLSFPELVEYASEHCD